MFNHQEVRVFNTTTYRFVALKADRLPPLRQHLRNFCDDLKLKGTILLSEEGINLFLAGEEQSIKHFKQHLPTWIPLGDEDLSYKDSWSVSYPFRRMLVKIKSEIVPMGLHAIKPHEHTAPYLSAYALKTWYDEGRDMLVLDARNTYEVQLGAFAGAVSLPMTTFREFGALIDQLPASFRHKPVVTYCTGGIRCEKASALLEDKGFTKVYQLKDGILGYFERCGGEHFEGECFVFDHRVALNDQLQETDTEQCYACRHPLTADEKQHHTRCPYCQSDESFTL